MRSLPLFALLALTAAGPGQAEEWWVLPEESAVTFSGFSSSRPFEGKFTEFSGRFCFDERELGEAAGVFEFDVASATTGIRERDQIMKAPEWLNAKAHPTARFALTGLERLGPNTYRARGELEIKGARNKISFPLTLNLVDNQASGVVTIDRRDFNVGEGKWGESEKWVSYQISVSFRLRGEPTGEACRED